MLKTFSGRRASQNEYELISFVALMKEHGVTNYCEIGARHGDTAHFIMLALPIGSHGVFVDLPGGLWGTEKSKNALNAVAADLRSKGYVIDVIFADSQSPRTREQIASLGPFDAILIDGDHTLKGVTKDWNLYRDMAPLIAFHDIVGNGQIEKVGGRPVEVPIFWDRIKTEYSHKEFVDTDSLMGIGVILK